LKLGLFSLAGAALVMAQTPTQAPVPSQGAPANGPVLTLDDSIRIAERNAFSLRTAASTTEKARQRVNEARGNIGPKITANGSYNHTIEHTSFGGGASATTGVTTGGTTGTTGTTAGTTGGGVNSISLGDTQIGSVSASMPIDISGVGHKAIAATENQLLAARSNQAAADNDLRLNVKQGYFQVLQAKAQVAVAEENVTNAQERLTNAQQKLAAGTIARFDVLNFQTLLSQAQSDRITALNNLAVAKENFNDLLARPIETPFDVAEIPALPPSPAATDQLVAAAENNRPEIQAARANIQALKYVREATENTMLPSMSIGAQHLRLFSPGTVRTLFQETQAFLNLSVPIFDTGVTRARVKEARQDEEQAKIAYQQLQLGISLEVRQALSNLTNSAARLDVAQQQVQQAAEAYRLAIVRFNAGEGTTLDVTNAQAQLTTARTGLVNARYDYLRSYAALQRATAADAPKAPGVKPLPTPVPPIPDGQTTTPPATVPGTTGGQ